MMYSLLSTAILWMKNNNNKKKSSAAVAVVVDDDDDDDDVETSTVCFDSTRRTCHLRHPSNGRRGGISSRRIGMMIMKAVVATAVVVVVVVVGRTRHTNTAKNNKIHSHRLKESVQRLTQAGYHVCRPTTTTTVIDDHDTVIPSCYEFQQQQQQQPPLIQSVVSSSSSSSSSYETKNKNAQLLHVSRRYLQQLQQQKQEDETSSSNRETETTEEKEEDTLDNNNDEEEDNTITTENDDDDSLIIILHNLLAAVVCVGIAALAAGLTLGLLGLDPLVLLIKQRAATSPHEQQAARKLLPIIKQHHRLLVTLLLMNAAANEALPIFLEALVSPTIAILLSVTLVLFFGEIIPSAIFTGPNQLKLASRLVPVVRTAMWLMYPIAGPIAYLLDIVLHDNDSEGDDGGSGGASFYNRGELSALIRIQYEERLAAKRKRKKAQQDAATELDLLLTNKSDHTGALDFSSDLVVSSRHHHHNNSKSKRATKNELEHEWNKQHLQGNIVPADDALIQRSPSIHMDEVLMAEGALQMQTKVAIDVYTSVHKLFSIPSDMILNERNLVKIYACGYTRIPVYHPPDKTAICGLLMTKQLIVVQPKDNRPVGTLPLRRPHCVSPEMPLVHLINLLQTGGTALQGGGHMALVCARPYIANKALQEGQAIPETAGLMGVITLEDVLEALLQEQIYDEMDKKEREATRLARMVCQKWKRYVRRKKAGQLRQQTLEPAMVPVVKQAVELAATAVRTKTLATTVNTSDHTDGVATSADEKTPLVVKKPKPSPSKVVYSWFGHTPSQKKEPPRK